jgi:hypothetical protein
MLKHWLRRVFYRPSAQKNSTSQLSKTLDALDKDIEKSMSAIMKRDKEKENKEPDK